MAKADKIKYYLKKHSLYANRSDGDDEVIWNE